MLIIKLNIFVILIKNWQIAKYNIKSTFPKYYNKENLYIKIGYFAIYKLIIKCILSWDLSNYNSNRMIVAAHDIDHSLAIKGLN